jgi:hypothetical protein
VGTITAAVATTAAYYFGGNTTGVSSTSTANDQTLSINALGGLSGGWSNGSIQLSAPPISSLSATGAVSLSINGSTISIGAPLPTTQSIFAPKWIGSQALAQYGQGVVQVFPAFVDGNYSASVANLYVSMSMSTSPVSSYAGTLSMSVGVYTRNASTLSLASSGSYSLGFTNSSNNSTAVFSGLKNVPIPLALNMSQADYWIAIASQTTNANGNSFTISNLLYTNLGSAYAGQFGNSPVSTNQSVLGFGQYSTTSGALPSSIAFSQIQGTGSSAALAPSILFFNTQA